MGGFPLMGSFPFLLQEYDESICMTVKSVHVNQLWNWHAIVYAEKSGLYCDLSKHEDIMAWLSVSNYCVSCLIPFLTVLSLGCLLAGTHSNYFQGDLQLWLKEKIGRTDDIHYQRCMIRNALVTWIKERCFPLSTKLIWEWRYYALDVSYVLAWMICFNSLTGTGLDISPFFDKLHWRAYYNSEY